MCYIHLIYLIFFFEVGMTIDEYRTMFALWCLVKSPLMLGADLTKMEKESDAYEIITNRRLLAINQDSLGKFHKPCG